MKALVCPRAQEIEEEHGALLTLLRPKCHPYRHDEQDRRKIHIGVEDDKRDVKDAYLWELKPKPAHQLTPMDQAFLAETSNKDGTVKWECVRFMGVHRHSGYSGFFKPDLCEVLWLMQQHISLEKLKQCQAIYVTTEFLAHVRDDGCGRQLGETVCWFPVHK